MKYYFWSHVMLNLRNNCPANYYYFQENFEQQGGGIKIALRDSWRGGIRECGFDAPASICGACDRPVVNRVRAPPSMKRAYRDIDLG